MSRYEPPMWSKEAQKILIDKHISKKELAEALKVNYNQLINVLSGTVVNDTMQEKICTYLGVTV